MSIAPATRFVAYTRVSTERQGRSGLGLEAQEAAIMAHLGPTGGTLVASFTHVESGKRNDRPELEKAIAQAMACMTEENRAGEPFDLARIGNVT